MMENVISTIVLVIIGSLWIFILYQAIKNWKLVISYLLLPLIGMLIMLLVLGTGQFNNTVHPLLLGMAGIGIGVLMGHWLALKKNWG